jgi:hypothetical protein
VPEDNTHPLVLLWQPQLSHRLQRLHLSREAGELCLLDQRISPGVCLHETHRKIPRHMTESANRNGPEVWRLLYGIRLIAIRWGPDPVHPGPTHASGWPRSCSVSWKRAPTTTLTTRPSRRTKLGWSTEHRQPGVTGCNATLTCNTTVLPTTEHIPMGEICTRHQTWTVPRGIISRIRQSIKRLTVE